LKIQRLSSIQEKKPLITVVTVVYNSENAIESTILSVLSQTYKKIEYIIIDGGSSDATTQIIEKYLAGISLFVCEPDSGIYDAMNKAIGYANGEWIIFMNAGDLFSSILVLENVFNNSHYNFDVLYGDVFVMSFNKKKFKSARNLNSIYKGMPFCHQSVFVRTSIHKRHYFNISYRIASDFDFFIYLFQLNYKFKYLGIPISNVSSGGISDSRRIETIKEWWLVIKKTKLNRYLVFYFCFLFVKAHILIKLKKLLKVIIL
jgi:glycosyltransferase involved in cell wall biosynthesis